MSQSRSGRPDGGRGHLPVRLIAGGALLALLAAVAIYAATVRPPEAGGVVTPISEISHVHGLAFDPHTPDRVYLATHHGLVRREAGDRWVQVGTRRMDLMGFNVSFRDPDVLFASGHPEAGAREPNPLGLVRSTDGGQSWEILGMGGEADFHVLAVSPSDPDIMYGYNVARNPGLYTSRDGGRSWQRLAPQGFPSDPREVYDLAVHPADPQQVLAGTQRGLLVSRDGGRQWAPLAPLVDGPPVPAVCYSPADPNVILAYVHFPGGGLLRSRNGGQQWARTGFGLVEGDDAIGFIAVDPHDPRRILIASYGTHVFESVDDGLEWRQVVRAGRPQ